MGRIRTLKPEFHAHEELSCLPPETHLLAAALLNYADDEGYFNANPVLLKAGTTPLRNDQTRLEEQVKQLDGIGYLEIRRRGLSSIGRVLNFCSHQRVDRPTPSRLRAKFEELPTRDVLANDSRDTPEPLAPEGKGKEQGTGKGKEQAAQGAREVYVLPDWVPRKALDRFLAMRKKNRKPVTDEAIPLLVKKLEALKRVGHNPTAVLDQSTMNGWQGLFEVKGETNGSTQQNRGGQARTAGNLDALSRANAADRDEEPPREVEEPTGFTGGGQEGNDERGSHAVVLEGAR